MPVNEAYTVNTCIVTIAAVLLAGFTAQWLSWKFKIPSILSLLFSGILLGPVTGLVKVEELMGDSLLPLVSLAIAIILFAEGLGLRFDRIRKVKKILASLLSVGVFLSWAGLTVSAYYLLGFSAQMSFLLGALLVVTGPTVVSPLVKEVRPRSVLKGILRWEGTLIDPVGAVLSVLIFEAVLMGSVTTEISLASGLIRTIGIGLISGVVFSLLIIAVYRYSMIPNHLNNAFALTTAIAGFAMANSLQREAGFCAVTVMGIILANVSSNVSVHRIKEFKGSLKTILRSSLFIILAARLRVEDLALLDLSFVLFSGAVIGVRLISAFVSTTGSGLIWKERLFIGLIAPRGIIAAAMASMFAMELGEAGFVEAHKLVPIAFAVIAVTGVFYGIFSKYFARWLGVTTVRKDRKHFAGINHISPALANELRSRGIRILMLDHKDITPADIPENIFTVAEAGNDVAMLEIDASGSISMRLENEEPDSVKKTKVIDLFNAA